MADATWLFSPATSDFNTGTNWDTGLVPTNVAVFDASNRSGLTFSANTTIGGWTFNVGAEDYVFLVGAFRTLTFDGAGIIVNGGSATISNEGGTVNFTLTSKAGSATINNGAGSLSILNFTDFSSAENATITNGSVLAFFDHSTAGSATITNDSNGTMSFTNTSNAGSANITNAFNATLDFNNTSSAESSTLINNYLVNFNSGSTAGDATITNNFQMFFNDTSSAGSADITVTDGTSRLINFVGSSTAGTATITNNELINFGFNSTAASAQITNNDTLRFLDNSTAGSAAITNNGDEGFIRFSGSSTAGSATIVNDGEILFIDTSDAGDADVTNNSRLLFSFSSSADNATITNSGVVAELAFLSTSNAGTAAITNNGWYLSFNDQSSAGTANIVNNTLMLFFLSASAGAATITNNDDLRFNQTTTGSGASITTSSGAQTTFHNQATGGGAVFDTALGGTVDFSDSTGPNDDHKLSAGSISGAGTYVLGANELTVSSGNVAGTISGVGGSLVMGGFETLTLAGLNSYTGGTTVNAGTLIVASAIGIVTVNDGGTLGGNGTTGTATINSGGILAPGASAGILHTGNISFATGATFSIELGGTATPGTDYDQLAVTGSVTLTSALLSISLVNGFDPVSGDSFIVINNDGTDAVNGTFITLAGYVVAEGRTFKVDYQGGDGNDVTLTAGGVVINGTPDDETIDGANTPIGQPLPTASGDIIFGLEGSDHLDGLAGDDVLVGGLGKDFLTGGVGADTFDFDLTTETSKGALRDVITGFEHLVDHIDLFDIDAKSGAGNQAFKFIGKHAFGHHKGELHYKVINPSGTANDKTIVEGDINGDGKADFQIELAGLMKLTKGDFLL